MRAMENIHTIDSLRELNAKLLTEIAKLRKKNDKIPELEKNLLRVKELEQKNMELEARLVIVEQASFVVDGQTQNGKKAIAEVWLSKDNLVSTIDLSNSVVDHQNNADTKSIEGVAKVSDKEINDFVLEEPIPKMLPVNLPQSCKRYPKLLEEKEMDSFLDSENKKMVSNLMRERNREKKLQTQELMSPISSKEGSSMLEESSIYNSHVIEKEKQNEISVEHLVNIVSDDNECQKVISVTKSNVHMIKFSEVSIPTAPNSLVDSKVISPDNSPKANDYNDPMPSSIEKGTNEVQTEYNSDCSHDNDSEEDISFSDNDKINDIDTMVSDDEEDAGYYYDLRTGNVAYKKLISVY
ncbi:10656_t:CDS:2 [Gigaspora margarita]|uniref:10656_t:CDS:1 n=1 Tax=Gigaspora margarita TaxID=4874 RepID=A0ABM8W0Y1_GIGMA|nr:10656_t:CDS:2 [Gigaspora margarita]